MGERVIRVSLRINISLIIGETIGQNDTGLFDSQGKVHNCPEPI